MTRDNKSAYVDGDSSPGGQALKPELTIADLQRKTLQAATVGGIPVLANITVEQTKFGKFVFGGYDTALQRRVSTGAKKAVVLDGGVTSGLKLMAAIDIFAAVAEDNDGDNNVAQNDAGRKTAEEFIKHYSELIIKLTDDNGYDLNLIASVLYHESSEGTGFVGGKLRIRFEVHHFLSIDGGAESGSSKKYASSQYYKKYFDLNASNTAKGHKWREVETDDYIIVHPTGTGKDNDLQWRVFEHAKTLNAFAAYNSISMGIPQIMGFNHAKIGMGSAEEMFTAFNKNNATQIEAFFKLIARDSKLSDAFKSYTDGNMEIIATKYNGGSDNANYKAKIASLYSKFEEIE